MQAIEQRPKWDRERCDLEFTEREKHFNQNVKNNEHLQRTANKTEAGKLIPDTSDRKHT